MAVQAQTMTPERAQQVAQQVQAAADQVMGPKFTIGDLSAALDAGRATALLEQVLGGQESLSEQLAEWIESEPPMLWLFLRWVANSPHASEYQQWAEEMDLD